MTHDDAMLAIEQVADALGVTCETCRYAHDRTGERATCGWWNGQETYVDNWCSHWERGRGDGRQHSRA